MDSIVILESNVITLLKLTFSYYHIHLTTISVTKCFALLSLCKYLYALFQKLYRYRQTYGTKIYMIPHFIFNLMNFMGLNTNVFQVIKEKNICASITKWTSLERLEGLEPDEATEVWMHVLHQATFPPGARTSENVIPVSLSHMSCLYDTVVPGRVLQQSYGIA